MANSVVTPKKASGKTARIIPNSIEILNSLIHEGRCSSIMVSMSVDEYLKFTEASYNNRGMIDGQREMVQTTTALRIRERMSKDFENGAILPPVVVGLLVDTKRTASKSEWTASEFSSLLGRLGEKNVSIIDGMQRTSVLRKLNKATKDRLIRVEFWLANETSDLTYRMLVLNSGQVPWNLRRQIEGINSSLIEEIRSAAGKPLKIFEIDDKKRRRNAGEFQANDLIEMYLAFCLKKFQLDKESILADQFSRLDMIDAISKDGFFNQFIDVLKLLLDFDAAFCKYDIVKKSEPQKFYSGKSIFDSQPSCVGFMAAAAQHIWGLPGMDRSKSEISKARIELFTFGKDNLKAIQGKSPEIVRDFLDLSTLNQVLMMPQSGKIGEFERSLFFNAYKILFSNKLRNMTPCWRA